MELLSFWLPWRPLEGRADDRSLLDLAEAAVKGEGGGWEQRLEPTWCYLQPAGHAMPDQGWKLHLSATVTSAAQVLGRALGILLPHRVAFKFARSHALVAALTSGRYRREGAGKFMTVYPADLEQFRVLAELLHQATAGLDGPVILSDRPYAQGSLVHYRYGAFAAIRALGHDGEYRAMLRAPDGSLVEDRREAWFSPPAWAPPPFDGRELQTATEPGPVLLAGRFLVREAIRHANKGGVFQGVEVGSHAPVVVKQARRHVGGVGDGWDQQTGLRQEAAILDRLAPLGSVPRRLELFEQAGDLFLVEELIDGVQLRQRIAELDQGGSCPPWPAVAALARRLVELVSAVHAAGIVLRDFTPTNVMVRPDGSLYLVDLELGAEPGAAVVAAGTPGYVAPEQVEGARADPAADRFSLGALLALVATGNDPPLFDGWPAPERLAPWLAAAAAECPSAARIAPAVLGLMEPDPDRRWGLDRVRALLDEHEPARRVLPAAPEPDLDRLIADATGYLTGTVDPWADEHPWPTACIGRGTDPCNLQFGAAGPLAALAAVADRSEVTAVLGRASAWVERRAGTEPRVLPGLLYGRAGTAWALRAAAVAVADSRLADRAAGMALALPLTWPNPDVTHGAAGALAAQLHFWRATGDPRFRRRAQVCAEGLLRAADRHDRTALWPIPASFPSKVAGHTFYGFAHGAAGIGCVLLAAGLAFQRANWIEVAAEAGEALSRAALIEGGAAWWPRWPGQTLRMVHWCNGSAGVGAFLIRLWQATGTPRYRELAEMAAIAVHRARLGQSASQCHGLAGHGELLLDLAAATGEHRYQAMAEDLVVALVLRRSVRDGRVLFPSNARGEVAAGYGVGMAGVLEFLVRLRDGGPRWWLDELSPRVATPAATVADSPERR